VVRVGDSASLKLQPEGDRDRACAGAFHVAVTASASASLTIINATAAESNIAVSDPLTFMAPTPIVSGRCLHTQLPWFSLHQDARSSKPQHVGTEVG
jgi:hypothetical protein